MPSNKASRVCWDTCIVLDALQKVPGPRYEAVKEQITDAERGMLRIVISAVTLAEAYYVKDIDREEGDRRLESFFDNEYVDVYNVDDAVAVAARKIMRDHQDPPGTPELSLPDAVILATACRAGASILFTRDGQGKNNRKPLLHFNERVGSPPVRVVMPTVYLEEQRARQASAKNAEPMFDFPAVPGH